MKSYSYWCCGLIPWYCDEFDLKAFTWVKVFKNGLSNIYGKQPLKNFTWSILEYLDPYMLWIKGETPLQKTFHKIMNLFWWIIILNFIHKWSSSFYGKGKVRNNFVKSRYNSVGVVPTNFLFFKKIISTGFYPLE